MQPIGCYLGHDGDPLGVNGAQVGIFKQPHQVSLASLLQRSNGGRLEPQVSLEVLGNLSHLGTRRTYNSTDRDLTNQSLEGQLPDKQLGGLLVSADLAESNSAGPDKKRQ